MEGGFFLFCFLGRGKRREVKFAEDVQFFSFILRTIGNRGVFFEFLSFWFSMGEEWWSDLKERRR